jgi:hypothetical protein
LLLGSPIFFNRHLRPRQKENTVKLSNYILATIFTLGSLSAFGETPGTHSTPAAASAPTAIPALVPYSGVAIAGEGKPFTGEVTATFLIYKDEQGGEPLWTESQLAAIDPTGHYKVQLGATNPNGLPSDLFATGEARWLEVQIAGEAAQPRVLLASVPYALKAADAATLGGLPASAFVLAGTKTAAIAALAAAVITPDTNANVTTPGGTTGYLPVFTGTTTVGNSILYASSTGVGVGDVPNSTAIFDVNGKSIWRGLLNVSRAGTATTSTGYDSFPMFFQASSYNSSSKAAVLPAFQWQAEPTGNDTTSPGATFNMLASATGGTPAETGLYFNTNGTLHFASGQTFPGTGTGNGTITGVTAGTGLTGGGTSGKVTLNVNTGIIPTLSGNNTFTGSNTFKPSIYEDTDINIDNTNANDGGVSPGLRFGSASGEGIASQRASGGDNQYGLDFFTDYTRQMSIAEGGWIGIGGTGTPGIALSVYANANNNAAYFQSAQNASTLYIENDSSNTEPTVYGVGPNGSCSMDNAGNLDCTGGIYGSSPDFKIDHPTDPANKYLVHASVESSEMINIYSGNVTTDELGLATVQLPTWFEAENGDFRYQLTVVDERFAQAVVSKRIAGHQFTIHTNASKIQVSWQITAVRQDGYAKAHPLIVEQDKPSTERGLYRHPEYFGQPKEKGIAWSRKTEQTLKSKTGRNAANLHNEKPIQP